MPNNEPERSKQWNEPYGAQQVLQWAMCQPGVCLLSSLAVGMMLACRQETNPQAGAEPPQETKADLLDGDIPLSI